MKESRGTTPETFALFAQTAGNQLTTRLVTFSYTFDATYQKIVLPIDGLESYNIALEDTFEMVMDGRIVDDIVIIDVLKLVELERRRLLV